MDAEASIRRYNLILDAEQVSADVGNQYTFGLDTLIQHITSDYSLREHANEQRRLIIRANNIRRQKIPVEERDPYPPVTVEKKRAKRCHMQ